PAGSRLVVGPNEERDVVARVALSFAHPIRPDLLDIRQAPFDSAPNVLRRRGRRRGWDLGGNDCRQKGETAKQQQRSPRIHHCIKNKGRTCHWTETSSISTAY